MPDTAHDPAEGLPILVAIGHFNQAAILAHRYWLLRAATATRDLSDPERAELAQTEEILLDDLVCGLRDGDFAARGRRRGDAHWSTIPPEWWTDVSVDIEASSASTEDLAFLGIRIFERTALPTIAEITSRTTEAPAEVTRKARGPAPATTMRVVAEMLAHLHDGRETAESLRTGKEESLAALHRTSRYTVRKARALALSEFETPTISDK